MNSSIENIRHSLAHLLALAVIGPHDPNKKPAIGPTIENGFYYDFEVTEPITDKHLSGIENGMRKILKTWKGLDTKFVKKAVSRDEARKMFKNNPYKLELVDEILDRGEDLTVVTVGEPTKGKDRDEQVIFTDLCRGGHVNNIEELNSDAFKLTRVAGAYWRGDEKNKMLTRIYGVAFATKKELDEHLQMLEQAKKRDHKVLGRELDLFTFSDLVGPGLPLFTPKGTILRDLLDDFVWSLRHHAGYEKVDIPHITKKDLYERSGHWDKFSDELFRIKTREGHEFAIKPMNCPHHIQIFARKNWSFRELPQRYTSTTKIYRDEQTGELSGLSRVRSVTQDDAHVFCRFDQIEDESLKIWNIVDDFYQACGFPMEIHLSLHDPKQPKKYLGDKTIWKKAEDILRSIAKKRKIKVVEDIGEAAFYGPKIDFIAKDSIGRRWQVATIQLDFSMPERFDLTYVDNKGKKERVVMIHAAIMGSIERFLSILIEHTAGAFPLWLSPVQVAVLPINDKLNKYAKEIATRLSPPREGEIKRGLTSPNPSSRGGEQLRIEIDDRSESIGRKIREAEKQKIPYMLIIGEKEKTAGNVSVRQRGQKDLGSMKLDKFIAKIEKEIATKAIS